MIMGLTRPSIYLPIVMVVWGVVSGCSGAVQNFAGIAACRFFLGIAEAPFFAGVAFLFSGWYTRSELGFRLGLFFCAAMFSGAFGGLFAAGIAAAFESNKIPSCKRHSSPATVLRSLCFGIFQHLLLCDPKQVINRWQGGGFLSSKELLPSSVRWLPRSLSRTGQRLRNGSPKKRKLWELSDSSKTLAMKSRRYGPLTR